MIPLAGRRTSMRVLASLVLAALAGAASAQDEAVTLRAGTLLDGAGGRRSNATVVVKAGKIAAVDGPTQGTVYDLSKLTLMPGGIDTHVHLANHFDLDGRAHSDAGGREPVEQATLFAVENDYRTLMAGLTTVQSLGDRIDKHVRDFVARGSVPGPRVITSYEWVTEGDPETLRRAVRERVEAGADAVKIFASKSIREAGVPTLSEEQLKAA